MDASKAFNLSADHLALDFVNTLDNRFSPNGEIEKLESYADLLSFAGQSKVLTTAHVSALSRVATTGNAADALRQSIELRETLARIFYTLVKGQRVTGEDLQAFNDFLRDTSKHRVLAEQAGEFDWRWEGLDKDLEAPLWPVVQAAAELLASPNVAYIRACARESCRWLFVDVSKNHSRRWCDMKVCGNRVKASRYYAMHGRE